MTTKGRPLSITTIVKRLRHLRDNAFYDTVEQHLLDDIANILASNPNVPTKVLHELVNDLQGIFDRAPAHLQEIDLSTLASCIDSLARIEANRPVKVKATKTPDWIAANKAAAAKAVTPLGKLAQAETTGRQRSIDNLIGSIRLLLDEAGSGNAHNGTFTTLHHLIDMLDQVS